MGAIVVGLDNSEASRRAFHEAVREAQWRRTGVLAIHAVSLPATAGIEYLSLLDDLEQHGQESTDKQLGELAADYEDGFPVSVEHRVVTGHAGVQLIEAAKGTYSDDGEPAELVVLGSRGLGGFKGLRSLRGRHRCIVGIDPMDKNRRRDHGAN